MPGQGRAARHDRRTYRQAVVRACRMAGATRPEDATELLDRYETEIRLDWEARGYEQGRLAVCRCGECPVD